MRRMLCCVVTTLLLFIHLTVHADPVTTRADDVLTAVRKGDDDALIRLSGAGPADPWLVADELCFRGEFDAAATFAALVSNGNARKLSAYVAARRANPSSSTARQALAAVDKALRSKRPADALAAIRAVKTTGEDLVSAHLQFGRGLALRELRRFEEAARVFLELGGMLERLGWLARASAALHEGGICAYRGADWPRAISIWKQKVEIDESRGDRRGGSGSLGNIATAYRQLSRYPEALEYEQRCLAICEELGDQAEAARSLGSLGYIHFLMSDFDRARELQHRALAVHTELGNRDQIALTLARIAIVDGRLGKYLEALDGYKHALKLWTDLGGKAGVAATLGNLGNVYSSLGEYEKALDHQERALAMKKELGDRAGISATLLNIGYLHDRLGDYGRALVHFERALSLKKRIKHRAGVASALRAIGDVHLSLGAFDRALQCQTAALELTTKLRDRTGEARILGSLGNTCRSLGRLEEAKGHHERALSIYREIGDRSGEAACLGNLGNLSQTRGDFEEALGFQQAALAIRLESKDRAGAAHTRGNIGSIQTALGQEKRAVETQLRVLAEARELGLLRMEVRTLGNLTVAYRRLGNDRAAVDAARAGIERLPLLVRGLAEEQAGQAGDQWSTLLGAGIRAGTRLGDAKSVAYLLESRRAASLLESLGGREALGRVSIPDELRMKDRSAYAAVLAARHRMKRAIEVGKRDGIRAARESLEAARQARLDVVSRIQREARAAADVTYPVAATLEQIQGALAKDEALVLYADTNPGVNALVVTPNSARVLRLGRTKDVEALCRQVDPGDPARDPSAPLRALRRKVIDPLCLGPEVKRLLVSPVGGLSRVPFALLAADLEVAYVPSGTTYRLLKGTGQTGASGVLALGDPDYGTRRDETTLVALRRSGPLVPLPATRHEVESIADVALLGSRATEGGLVKALAAQSRWRAVHFACHGQIDPERPMLSALALTAGGGDDGFLTTMEVFRMTIAADLVVLSACESGRGKAYRTEGVVGFTRAFMFAGASRVIVSLWKVNDAATRELMVKFYGLWNPRDGSKGIPAATALKLAQEHVRSQSRWRHPHYWAAWVLWGLPE